MFKKKDRVVTTRKVRAGLSEDGPEVCDHSVVGIVIDVDPREPDGIHVVLQNGVKWWFKPNQLEVINEQISDSDLRQYGSSLFDDSDPDAVSPDECQN